MDALVELLPLLLIAAYYLLRARHRAQRQRQARREAPQEPLVSGGERREVDLSEPTPFQQFLQQVEEAMAEAVGDELDRKADRETDRPLEVEVAPSPAPLPAPPAKPVRPPAPTYEFRAPAGSFDVARPTDHERHGFGAENPLSEESFERRPPGAPAPVTRPDVDPHELRPRPPAPPARRMPTVADWRRRLTDPAAAREAFVLQTIFGERGGRARDPRP